MLLFAASDIAYTCCYCNYIAAIVIILLLFFLILQKGGEGIFSNKILQIFGFQKALRFCHIKKGEIVEFP